MRVMKFGGTSVGSGEMMRRVASIVADAPHPRVAVASAMSGVTDGLVSAARSARLDESSVEPFIKDVQARHDAAAEAAVEDIEARNRVLAELAVLYEKLERVLYGVAYTEELTAKTRDLVVSFGERLSVRVLAGALRDAGVAAEAVDADRIGMVTDGRFGNANPLLGRIEDNFKKTLRPTLEEGVVPVLTGFFGCDDAGHVTTFGRGGSDYSASIVANALNADRLEVWKDVDGFLTADPRIIPDAVPVARMTYDEAAELAYFGAKVLHPRTVEPAKAKGIPVVVRNTTRPSVDGTVIAHEAPDAAPGLRSVAVKEGLGIIRLYGPGMAYTPGVGEQVFTALGRERINVYNMAASQASFALLLDATDVDRAEKVLSDLTDGVIQSVEGLRDMSLVCVVGEGIGATHGTAGRIFTAVGAAGVNVEMISVGASEIALNFVIKTPDTTSCIRGIHEAFLSKEADNGK